MNRVNDDCTVEDRLGQLTRAGWSIGEVRHGNRWLVTGSNGENLIHASGTTAEEAWQVASQQAAAVGMLAE